VIYLSEHNAQLLSENKSLRLIIKDFEEMRVNEESIIDQLSLTNDKNKEFENKLSIANKTINQQEKQIQTLEAKLSEMSEQVNKKDKDLL
jgi:glutamate synthase domain-containing protein 1